MHSILEKVHPQWHDLLNHALGCLDTHYLDELQKNKIWLPGFERLFAAFSLPLSETQYILLGESPYPRAQSANGYAFWDNAVDQLWSKTGLSKTVNRATSLRNWIKMLLIARGDLSCEDSSQTAIAELDKSSYWQTAEQLFLSLINKGFLLLNASLVYRKDQVLFDARHWQPFIEDLLTQLARCKPSLYLLLFGRLAQKVPGVHFFPCLIAPHPYNLSFITNADVLAFFKPLDLLNNESSIEC